MVIGNMNREIKFRAWNGKEMFPVAGLSWRSPFGAGEPERNIYPNIQNYDRGYAKPSWFDWHFSEPDWPGNEYHYPPLTKEQREELEKKFYEECREVDRRMKAEMSKVVFMQFTGLLDINGKEIYEGDIIKNDHTHGIVKFCELDLKYEVETDIQGDWKNGPYISIDIPLADLDSDSEWEVIGNFFENPELLK